MPHIERLLLIILLAATACSRTAEDDELPAWLFDEVYSNVSVTAETETTLLHFTFHDDESVTVDVTTECGATPSESFELSWEVSGDNQLTLRPLEGQDVPHYGGAVALTLDYSKGCSMLDLDRIVDTGSVFENGGSLHRGAVCSEPLPMPPDWVGVWNFCDWHWCAAPPLPCE